MFVETHVLGGDEGVDHFRRYFVEVGVHAVARIAEVAAKLLAVRRIEHRGELVLRILEFLHRRHITYHSVVDQDEKSGHK